MRIADREIGNGQPSYIIAEAGTNHMGSFERASTLILKAAEAGASAIKFQAFVKDEKLFCPVLGDEQRIEYWNQTVLDDDDWRRLSKLAHSVDIHFILSVFQPSAVQPHGGVDHAGGHGHVN